MLDLVSKIVCNTILSALEMYIIKILINSDSKISKTKNIITLLLLVTTNTFLAQVEYSTEAMIARAIIAIIILRKLYNASVGKLTVSYLLFLFITILADLINYSILKNFFTLDQLRGSWYGMLFSNIDVAIIIILFFKIGIIRTKLIDFINKLNKNNIITPVVYFALTFFVIINLLYNISRNQQNTELYIMNILIISIFLILIILLMLDRDKYNQLLTKYDMMSKYTREFEDTIDEMELDNHEKKNQLAMLRSYIEGNNKKQSLKLLSEMTNEKIKKDGKVLLELRNIPKGGIKGLLYYKIMIAEQKHIKVVVQVSKKCTKMLKTLAEEKVKALSRLIGVYFDNAIEAAEKSKKKIVSIEIYSIKDNLELVISNTIEDLNIKLEDIAKKGFSTKGKGRGKGVYLVNKLVAKHDWLSCKTQIINDYYIQYVEIKRPNQK